jgi:beta-galactosidase
MRTVIPFNTGWTFLKKDVGFKEAEKVPGESVTLPHTWNGSDGQDGQNDYYRGTCFYVKHFPKPSLNEGEQVFIEFKGVNERADVYLNGQLIVSHVGGYSAFRGELTPALKETNCLVVAVSNSPREDSYPQAADFTFYGGIYRDVNLIIVPATHFDLVTSGSLGIQTDAWIQEEEGRCRIEAFPVPLTEMTVRIEDEEHKTVASGKGGDTLVIPKVHRWDGIHGPYLYTVIASLSKEGILQDEVRTEIGFRSIRLDSRQGFFLNDRPYPLKGVSRHQDRPIKGNAISQKDQEEDIALIQEMGANAVRLAHYQQDDYFYSLCDHAGIIVWSEIPYLSYHRKEADGNALLQMEELLRQTNSHPAIVFRCLSNEITIGKTGKDCLDEHKKLAERVRKEDPRRLSVIADYVTCRLNHPLNAVPDAVGFNYYFGWYTPFAFLTGLRLDLFHILFPKRPVGLSEYGAEGMPNLHSRHPRRLDNSEEYQACYHEKLLKILNRRKYLWGSFAWNMFDFGSDGRNQGGDPGKNHKGLITFDRKTKKDAFYLYQAYWTSKPFVHLCSQRYVYRSGRSTLIKVYSNQAEVALLVNGKKVASRKGERIFRFKVPPEEKMEIIALSGYYQDRMTIFKVSKEDSSYRCPKSNPYSWEKKKGRQQKKESR